MFQDEPVSDAGYDTEVDYDVDAGVLVSHETHVWVRLCEDDPPPSDTWLNTPSSVAELAQRLSSGVPAPDLLVGNDGNFGMFSLDTVEHQWGLTADGVRDCVACSFATGGFEGTARQERAELLVPGGCSLLFALLNWARVCGTNYLSLDNATGITEQAPSRMYVYFAVPVGYQHVIPVNHVAEVSSFV